MESVLILFTFAVLTFTLTEYAARPHRDIWRSL